MENKNYKIQQQLFYESVKRDFQLETVYNPEDGSLPFALLEPTGIDKKSYTFWICSNENPDKEIVGVLFHREENEEPVKMMFPNNKLEMSEAENIRDEFLKAGWIKMKLPGVDMEYEGMEENEKLTKDINHRTKRKILRKQRRKIEKMKKQNQKIFD
jgi:hypothetical protein